MKKMKINENSKRRNQAGFMTAEFLFAFTMVIGCGILIFAMTFSLSTIEIAQYIVWSAARAQSAGNINAGAAEQAARTKYANLTAAFPLLTGNGSSSPWFQMSKGGDVNVGDLSIVMGKSDGSIDPENRSGSEPRQPWIGVQADIDLILFKGLQIPFLGKIALNPNDFKFPVRGIILRQPSQAECQGFFTNKFQSGVQAISGESWNSLGDPIKFAAIEDNGC